MMIKNKNSLILFLIILIVGFLIIPEILQAGGGNEAELSDKVSTENLSGLNLWLVNIYNDNRILLAFLTITIMGVLGISIAFITELILKVLGLEVTKIKHME